MIWRITGSEASIPNSHYAQTYYTYRLQAPTNFMVSAANQRIPRRRYQSRLSPFRLPLPRSAQIEQLSERLSEHEMGY
jgi:hypothetical protein